MSEFLRKEGEGAWAYAQRVYDLVYVRDIERLTGQKIPLLDLPENFRDEVAAAKALRPAPKRKSSSNGGARNRPNRSGKSKANPDGQRRQPKRQRQRRRKKAA